EAECLCSLKIDDKLKLGRLHDRKIGRLSALENVAGICANLTETVGDICSVAHQRARFDQFARGNSHGDAFAYRERGKLHSAAGVECITRKEQRVGWLAGKCVENRINLAAGAGFEDLKLQPEGASGLRHLFQSGLGGESVARIDQQGDLSGLGHQLVQERQPFGINLIDEKIYARRVAARPSKAGDQTKL